MHTDAPQFWGAVPLGRDTWSIAIWAPQARTVAVDVAGAMVPMTHGDDGVWRARVTAAAGTPYVFHIDGAVFADPATRQQQGDVHGASLLTDTPTPPPAWPGIAWCDSVIMEIHIGTFTAAGTLRAAIDRLPDLAALGINTIEVMPLAQFAGDRGWGYDGVLPYAVHPAYGTVQDAADFVAAAHALGLSVLLDVVYNHFGPEGSYLHTICPAFFDDDRDTPWGAGIDYTQPAVRDYFIGNAVMWVRDVGFDGLRFDAVHQIVDPSSPELMVELSQRLRALDPGRPVHLVAEDERNLTIHRDPGVTDAAWNDDYHHVLHTLLTGEGDGYYASYAVDPIADLVLALSQGQVVQGQPREPSSHDAPPRGAPSGHLPPSAFVNFNQNHDQIGNRAGGERLITLCGTQAAQVAHGILLTAPFVPLMFQGEEIGATTLFPFFCDFDGALADLIRKGRQAEFGDFDGFGDDLPDPMDPAIFRAARPYDTPPADAGDWQALTARLLTWRSAQVTPLLRSGWVASTAAQIGPRAVRATWTFKAGQLHALMQLGAPLSPEHWRGADGGLTLGAPEHDFAFCTWTTA